MKSGRLEIVCGSMFSGKTEELLSRLKRAEYARKRVVTIKHQIDVRVSEGFIHSHSGGERPARAIASCLSGIREAARDAEVVGIDEIQFFPSDIVCVIQEWVDEGKRVVAAGLDMDFRGEPFGVVPTLMALADQVTKMRAICVRCGNDANFTQRLIDGEPASYEDQTIRVGGSECYEARCRNCYQIDKRAYALN